MGENLVSVFLNQSEKQDENTALQKKTDGNYRDISWNDYRHSVLGLAGAFIELGINEGDRVAIFSYNSPEWAITDLAALCVKAVVVPIYYNSTGVQAEYILKDSETKLILVGNREQLRTVLSIKGQLPDLRYIIGSDDIADSHESVLGFNSTLERYGRKKISDSLEKRLQTVEENDTATIVYTSGTTGEPKGVMLTHRNLIANIRSDMSVVRLTPSDVGLSFLPTSHVLDRVVVHYMNIVAGGAVAYAESMDTIMEDVSLVKPTAMCGVPRMFEKIYTAVLDRMKSGPALRQKIFFWACKVGEKYVICRQDDITKPGSLLKLQYKIADKLVYGKLRELFGGRLRLFASGGAHLQEEIDIFFRAIGIPIMHGYGLTEATCTVTLNTTDEFKPGTLGRPLPGVEVKIAEDGEILVRGDLLMQGYYKRPDDTTAVLADGWLYTGDLGYLDSQGYLVMNDRKKDILVTSGGKNISPQRIETLFKLSRYIEQAVVIAEGKKFVSALIVPNFQEVKTYCEQSDIKAEDPDEMIRHGMVRSFFGQLVDEANQKLEGFEQVKNFALLSRELTTEAGELTHTLKVKRRVVDQKFKDIIESLYS